MSQHRFKRIIVVCNPVSTNAQRTRRRLAELRALSPASELTVLTTLPDGREANRALLREQATKLGPGTLLCIAAGDGTVNLVIETLLREPVFSPVAERTPILPLWGGNGNDLAHMLNGRPAATKLRRIMQRARVAHIHPLCCTLTLPDGGGKEVYLAACYASFGASAFTSQVLSKSVRKNTFLHRVPGVRFVQELYLVVKAMRGAPTFLIQEGGQQKSVYDYVCFKGPRMAKVSSVKRRLDDKTFHRAVVEHKRFFDVMHKVSQLTRRRTSGQFERTHAAFTVLDAAWAQFDGETVQIAPGTRVKIALAEHAFSALALH